MTDASLEDTAYDSHIGDQSEELADLIEEANAAIDEAATHASQMLEHMSQDDPRREDLTRWYTALVTLNPIPRVLDQMAGEEDTSDSASIVLALSRGCIKLLADADPQDVPGEAIEAAKEALGGSVE